MDGRRYEESSIPHTLIKDKPITKRLRDAFRMDRGGALKKGKRRKDNKNNFVTTQRMFIKVNRILRRHRNYSKDGFIRVHQ